MRVLVVGSGGREHALAWKLAQSPELTELHAAPGNPGISRLGRCHPVHPEDAEGLLALARELDLDLVVVGPEAPLVAGVADGLRQAGVPVFGPSAAAAQIEGSKLFAKELMEAAGVPTAEALATARPPCVLKLDSLATGKGVVVCRTTDEVEAGLRQLASLGGRILVEELLEGEEVSLFALSDGERAVALAPAQDFKRLEDGDAGPNTGGMGSYSPVSALADDEVDALVDMIHRPVLAALAARGTPFIGLLYAGLMLTETGPRVLEFNCRFGDPETQAILAREEADLLPALIGAATGEIGDVQFTQSRDAAVTVVLASRDPLGDGDHGTEIKGVDAAEATGALIFHAGTALRGDRLVTNGRRILNVTGVGPSVAEARSRAYEAVELISFEGMRYRTDIAAKAERAHA